MIQKITNGEYLKRFDNMSGAERQTLTERVGQWLRSGARLLARKAEEPMARLQNVMQVSSGWNDAECQAWTEGVRLLTAFVGTAETWLPEMIYTKSAKRTIRRMTSCLEAGVSGVRFQVSGDGPTEVIIEKNPALFGSPNLTITEEQKQRIVEKYTKKAMEKMAAKEEPAEGTSKATQAVAAASIPATKPDYGCKAVKLVPVEECRSMPGLNNHVYSAIPPRPKHIDQYVHLLPEKTQEKAKQYGPLKREIEAARENMRLLMNDPHSSAADREKWAKLAARNDEKIAKINAELDREWEKVAATGRVVVDDLGMAHLLPDGEPSEGSRFKVQGSSDNTDPAPSPAPTMGGEPAAEDAAKEHGSSTPLPSRGGAGVGSDTSEPEKRKPGRPKKQPEMSDEEKAKRREYLKKWLRDTRTQPSDERRKQWTKNCKELLALGGEITDSIRKAGEYYGVDLTRISTN